VIDVYHRLNLSTGRPPDRGRSSAEEDPVSWNKWIRQTHRWLSMTFTVAVIVTVVAIASGQEEPAIWVYYLPLLPLALLLPTGLYLFALPYVARRRERRGAVRAR
jgi:hypothetical protein